METRLVPDGTEIPPPFPRLGVQRLNGRDLALVHRGRAEGGCKLVLVERGELRFRQTHRAGRLHPGQFTVLDERLGAEIEAVGGYEHHVALWPGRVSPALHGQVHGDAASHEPLRRFVQAWATAGELSAQTHWQFGAALQQMLGVLEQPVDTQDLLRQRARALIDSKLAEITAISLADQLHLSRRRLDMLFAADGETVSAAIWRRRIERAAQRLRAPQAPQLTALAHELGFKDSSHFSRMFRQRMGLVPSQWRRMTLAAAQACP